MKDDDLKLWALPGLMVQAIVDEAMLVYPDIFLGIMRAAGKLKTRAWWIIFAVGAVLRLSGLGASAVWYDESFSAAIAALPLPRMITVAALDYHPPLWFLVEALFVWLMPRSEIALRLPAALFGLLSLPLLGRFADLLGMNTVAKTIGLLFAAVLPYQIWIAQDARVYSLLLCLILGNAIFGLQGKWPGYAATFGLALYANPIAPFYLLTVGVLIASRRNWKAQALATVGGLVAFAPYAPTFMRQAARPYWTGPLTGGGALTGLYLNWFAGTLGGGWLAWGALVVFAMLAVALIGIRRNWRLAFFTVLPFALIAAYSLIVVNVLFYRPLTPLSAPMYLWFAAVLARVRSSLAQAAACGVLIPLLIVGMLAWNPAAKGSALRDYARFIEAEWQPGDVVYHATATTQMPFAFYLRSQRHVILDEDLHPGLLGTDVQTAIGLPRGDLDELQWRRAWLIWADDPLLSDRAKDRMSGYVARYHGQLIGRVTYWQAAPIEIWLLEK